MQKSKGQLTQHKDRTNCFNISTLLWSDAFLVAVFSLIYSVYFVIKMKVLSIFFLHIYLKGSWMFGVSILEQRHFQLIFTSNEKNFTFKIHLICHVTWMDLNFRSHSVPLIYSHKNSLSYCLIFETSIFL